VKQSHKTLLLWVLLILMFVVIWQFLQPGAQQSTPVAFSDFMMQVHAKPEEQHVEKVSIKDHEYAFEVFDPATKTRRKYITIGPEANDALTKDLVEHNVKVSFEKEDTSPFWSSALMTVLPILPFGDVLPVHASASGGRWQGDELWQVSGAPAQ